MSSYANLESSRMKCNIVIPMAGEGNRFKTAGYNTPKPFITFNGKMMIEHVLSSFDKISAKFIIVIQKTFQTEFSNQLKKIKENYDVEYVVVPGLTSGAAITALASHKLLNPEYPVLFVDSDNIFENSVVVNFLEDAKKRDLAGSIITFKSELSCYSYALTDTKGILIKTKEKEVISDNAICGAYYVKNTTNFINSTIDLIVANDLQNGEFYMSNVYNYLLEYEKNVGIYIIDNDSFNCVGTPEQLENYVIAKTQNYNL